LEDALGAFAADRAGIETALLSNNAVEKLDGE
jgi:hypothetical protein